VLMNHRKFSQFSPFYIVITLTRSPFDSCIVVMLIFLLLFAHYILVIFPFCIVIVLIKLKSFALAREGARLPLVYLHSYVLVQCPVEEI